jgi:hypothetical protein
MTYKVLRGFLRAEKIKKGDKSFMVEDGGQQA